MYRLFSGFRRIAGPALVAAFLVAAFCPPAGAAGEDGAEVRFRCDSGRYRALVRPGGGAGLSIPLGPAEPIDRAASAFRERASSREPADADMALALSRELYRLVFAPLAPALQGAGRLDVKVEGPLALVPLEALTGPDGRFLIEDFLFTYRVKAPSPDLADGEAGLPAVFAHPDYDLDLPPRHPPFSTVPRPRSFGRTRFPRVPETEDEARAVERAYGPGKVRLFLKQWAGEETLRFLRPAPRVLHLATTGYFLADGQAGFLLAGANHTLGFRGREKNEGIMTAAKIRSLDLGGTKAVLLTGCQPAPGSQAAVQDLAAAFLTAGAGTAIMNLWPIFPKQNRRVMLSFHQRTARGAEPAPAMRAAGLDELARVRRPESAASPFSWAGYVVFARDRGAVK